MVGIYFRDRYCCSYGGREVVGVSWKRFSHGIIINRVGAVQEGIILITGLEAISSTTSASQASLK